MLDGARYAPYIRTLHPEDEWATISTGFARR
jgi:hypothetical protein